MRLGILKMDTSGNYEQVCLKFCHFFHFLFFICTNIYSLHVSLQESSLCMLGNFYMPWLSSAYFFQN